jgi:hypothetical protein
MIGLFFEVMPRPGHEQAYLDIAAGLRPELDKNPGLLFIDRFKSLMWQRIVLSRATLAKGRHDVGPHVSAFARLRYVRSEGGTTILPAGEQ